MAIQLSPGVNVSEIDLTTVVPAVATSIGGIAGEFNWGPANEVTIISSENQLVSTFGKPTSDTYETFFTAANFLSYASDLRVVRAISDDARNASTNNSNAQLITSRLDYDSNHATGAGDGFWAKWPGTIGNNLKVIMADSNTWSSVSNTFTTYADSAPATSVWASSKFGANDEVHILVIDATGQLSEGKIANTVLEVFTFASKAGDARNADGTSNYYKDVVNQKSKWIWWAGHPDANTNWGNSASNTSFSLMATKFEETLTLGNKGNTSSGNITAAYSLFKPEEIDISLLMTASGNSTIINHCIDNIAEVRKDCIVLASPSKANVVNASGTETTNIKNFADLITRSNYAVIDSGWKYQYDRYNDVYRWIPLNGDIAGLCARTDQIRDPWFSPAGLNRGVIKNVVKLAWNPILAQRDELYKYGINSVVTFPGEGTLLFGDKTFQNRPSAFDRINVRRLFIVLEKSIAKAARSSLFEFNDEFTRAQFVNLVEPFLRDVQGRRGIYDFRVVCDTTNNTGEVIDSNRFVGDIYIKPSRSINFIQLNFVAVRTGVAFDEIVGKF